MNKIIGFLISKENSLPKFDIFNIGMQSITIRHDKYFIILWGIGDLSKCVVNNKSTLSFPLTKNLLDRNILIYIENSKIIIENDWLGSIPVFYNTKYSIISTLSNLCQIEKSIDNRGLTGFCEFGYSVFEQTIFKDVKFMRYYSKLVLENDIKVIYKDDPILDDTFLEQSSASKVISLMDDYITKIEESTTGEIILPTSGGYDSRILNYFIKQKDRIRSFTYGISRDQSESIEVVHAKKISELYKTKWDQIELKEFHNFQKQWCDIYGFSTHTHGMYHIEFYTKILQKYKFDNPTFLSGIVGDAWSESNKFKSIESYQDLINLGLTHGMSLELKHLKINLDHTLNEEFFNKYKHYLKNDKIKSVFAIRTKILLISYLTQIPEYFGFPVWTPFLNYEIVKNTLNIPDQERKNRIWQVDFFKKVGLNLESMNLKSSKINKLDYEISKNANLDLIDVKLMSKYIDVKRLEKINRILTKINIFERTLIKFLDINKVSGLLKRLGFRNEYLKSLHEYYVIKAVEKGLKNVP